MPVIILDEGPGSAAAPENYNQQPVHISSVVDINYFKTPPGIVKIAQLIFGIITTCVGGLIFLMIVACLSLTGSILWFWIYFFQIHKKYAVNPPWIILEFYFTAGAFLLYSVMTLFSFIFLHWISAVFAVFTSVCYGLGAFFLFADFKVARQSPSPIST